MKKLLILSLMISSFFQNTALSKNLKTVLLNSRGELASEFDNNEGMLWGGFNPRAAEKEKHSMLYLKNVGSYDGLYSEIESKELVDAFESGSTCNSIARVKAMNYCMSQGQLLAEYTYTSTTDGIETRRYGIGQGASYWLVGFCQGPIVLKCKIIPGTEDVSAN